MIPYQSYDLNDVKQAIVDGKLGGLDWRASKDGAGGYGIHVRMPNRECDLIVQASRDDGTGSFAAFPAWQWSEDHPQRRALEAACAKMEAATVRYQMQSLGSYDRLKAIAPKGHAPQKMQAFLPYSKAMLASLRAQVGEQRQYLGPYLSALETGAQELETIAARMDDAAPAHALRDQLAKLATLGQRLQQEAADYGAASDPLAGAIAQAETAIAANPSRHQETESWAMLEPFYQQWDQKNQQLETLSSQIEQQLDETSAATRHLSEAIGSFAEATPLRISLQDALSSTAQKGLKGADALTATLGAVEKMKVNQHAVRATGGTHQARIVRPGTNEAYLQ